MISPYNDDYSPLESMFEFHVNCVYKDIDTRLGVTSDAFTKHLIYRCLFESWREEQKEAVELLKQFSTGEIYLLNDDSEILFNEWYPNRL